MFSVIKTSMMREFEAYPQAGLPPKYDVFHRLIMNIHSEGALHEIQLDQVTTPDFAAALDFFPTLDAPMGSMVRRHYSMLQAGYFDIKSSDHRLLLFAGVIIAALYPQSLELEAGRIADRHGRELEMDTYLTRNHPLTKKLLPVLCNKNAIIAMVIALGVALTDELTPQGRLHRKGGYASRMVFDAYAQFGISGSSLARLGLTRGPNLQQRYPASRFNTEHWQIVSAKEMRTAANTFHFFLYEDNHRVVYDAIRRLCGRHIAEELVKQEYIKRE